MGALEVRKLAQAFAATTIEAQKKGFEAWGVLGDWDNAYKTMNADYEIAQLKVFLEMLEKGLIYRRFKPVYWSPSSGSALAEAELEYNEKHTSKAAFIKFPLSGAKIPGCDDETVSATIWTTTPWTIPANKAIAVHADMEYTVVKTSMHGALLVATSRVPYIEGLLGQETTVLSSGILGADLAGLLYKHPLLPDTATAQPIITADFVTADSGTGLVHCAPGHGMDDYLVCLKHSIAPFSPVDTNGRFTADALPGSGLEGKEVLYGGNKAVIELLLERGVLLNLDSSFTHKYPYDWRTKRPVIVRATAQWFADAEGIKPFAVSALDSVKFIPESGQSRLTSFVQGRSEWCISRQRVWGVPIPALYDVDSGEPLLTNESVTHIIQVLSEHGTDAWFSPTVPDEIFVAERYRASGKHYTRGHETMDVWFDSGTSWSRIDERVGQPRADLYLEGSDQHRGWFQSSLLTSIAATGAAPFGQVLTHGFCLDAQGKKMSKSLGNVITPSDIISGKIPPGKASKSGGGIDVLRLWVAHCDYTKDVAVGDAMLSHIHEVLRKMRVTARFLVGNLSDWDETLLPYSELSAIDRFALARTSSVNQATLDVYRTFSFNRAVSLLTTYTNVDLSAYYLDIVKDRLYSDMQRSLSRRAAQTTCVHILRNYLSLISPLVPLLAEETWEHAPAQLREARSDQWFLPEAEWDNPRLVEDFAQLEKVRDAVKLGIEQAKKDGQLKVNLEAAVHLPSTALLEKYKDELAQMFIVSAVHVGSGDGRGVGKYDGEGEGEGEGGGSWAYKQPVPGGEAVVTKADGKKCMRCWVYTAAEEEGVCGRCEDVLAAHTSSV